MTVERYVDPDFTGTHFGTASNPWASLEDTGAWSTLNGDLASDDVIVYHSARKAGSDTNQTSTVFLVLRRTDTSTHRLTIDGKLKYNTNASSPSWTNYSGSSRFQITGAAGYSLTTANDTSLTDRNYITIQDMRFIGTESQLALLGNINNFILQDCYFRHDGSPTNGPGLNVASYGGHTLANIIIRRNTIARSQGEAVYVSGWYELGSTHVNDVIGDNILIEGNTCIDQGFSSGEADAIDVKDGWTNVVIRGNICYQATLGRGNIGISSESGGLIERNFVYNYGTGITIINYYNSTVGRTGSIIRNNVIVDCGGVPNELDAGIAITAGREVAYRYIDPVVYNNTVWGHDEHGLSVRDDATGIATGVIVRNNIFDNITGFAMVSPSAGKIASHSNNLYRKAVEGSLVQDGASVYTAANITTYEATALSTDPIFVSTATPYLASNFALQGTSPCIDTGATLTGFSNDFNDVTRPKGAGWERGAWEFTSVPIPFFSLRG